jgi:hypothetical protein
MRESERAGHHDASSRQRAARWAAVAGRRQPPGREDRSHDDPDPFRSARSQSPDRTASMKPPGYQAGPHQHQAKFQDEKGSRMRTARLETFTFHYAIGVTFVVIEVALDNT